MIPKRFEPRWGQEEWPGSKCTKRECFNKIWIWAPEIHIGFENNLWIFRFVPDIKNWRSRKFEMIDNWWSDNLKQTSQFKALPSSTRELGQYFRKFSNGSCKPPFWPPQVHPLSLSRITQTSTISVVTLIPIPSSIPSSFTCKIWNQSLTLDFFPRTLPRKRSRIASFTYTPIFVNSWLREGNQITAYDTHQAEISWHWTLPRSKGR